MGHKLTILAVVLLLAGASGDKVTTRQKDYMGTYVSITVAQPESEEVLAAIEHAFKEVAALEKVLSDTVKDSETAAVNQQAGVKPVMVSPELYGLIKKAHEISVESKGAFGVTFAALAGL